MYNFIDEIREQKEKESTYEAGGHPHTFVELFGGKPVQILESEPDISSFRDDNYYNSSENMLYVKKAEWSAINDSFDNEDLSYVYYDGRSVKKLVKDPDPKNFGDLYYYSLVSNRLFGKILKWEKCINV